MALIVQKFGGSSVADPEKIRACAARVLDERSRGNDVAVVVSAMGKTTDMLVKLAGECSPAPARREMDMLLATGEQVTIALMAMTLEALGQPAISFTGQQIGLTTDDVFSKAAIRGISGERLRAAIGAGCVPVVAGFQGITDSGEITTLGRGGSDTTAVAVAAALKADVCDIFTDVDGVYTADPRLVPNARKIPEISYEAMLEMAALGAKVMHDRSVRLGAVHKVPIQVRHSHRPDAGTLITTPREKARDGGRGMEKVEITGVALKENLGRVTLTDVPDRPGVASGIFAALAEANIPVDDIIQTVSRGGGATIAFTVESADIAEAPKLLERTLAALGGGGGVQVDTGFSKVSVVGVGIRGHAPAAALMFRTLASAGVNIANITTSEIRISAIIGKSEGPKALAAVHDAFGLGT
jgi:aspartate kinase